MSQISGRGRTIMVLRPCYGIKLSLIAASMCDTALVTGISGIVRANETPSLIITRPRSRPLAPD